MSTGTFSFSTLISCCSRATRVTHAVVPFLLVISLAILIPTSVAAAQIDPAVPDRVIPAMVAIAIWPM
jgi:hypothetical protein